MDSRVSFLAALERAKELAPDSDVLVKLEEIEKSMTQGKYHPPVPSGVPDWFVEIYTKFLDAQKDAQNVDGHGRKVILDV